MSTTPPTKAALEAARKLWPVTDDGICQSAPSTEQVALAMDAFAAQAVAAEREAMIASFTRKRMTFTAGEVEQDIRTRSKP